MNKISNSILYSLGRVVFGCPFMVSGRKILVGCHRDYSLEGIAGREWCFSNENAVVVVVVVVIEFILDCGGH